MDAGHTEDARGKALNRTKQNKNKEKIKISWCSESGMGPHAWREVGGCQTRREGASRVLLLQWAGGPLAVPQDATSLAFLTRAWGKQETARDQEIAVLLPHNSPALTVSMAPCQDLSPLVVTRLFLDPAVTLPA